MEYLNQPEHYLSENGALQTAREIAGQPVLWKQTTAKFYGEAAEIGRLIQTALGETDDIILTGAGTSSFIGLSLQGVFFSRTRVLTRAVATTDIVSHPGHYFNTAHNPLIISFARSGNSPESRAALQLADRFCKKCFHLIVTCDEGGDLAAYHSKNPVQVFVLPKGANDKGLAMTGSYTSMLLTGLLIAFLGERDYCTEQVAQSIESAEKILHQDLDITADIAQKHFRRAVFLGSGGLYGTAQEASLKLQELTDGRIICKADTYLGFRHGPKAVIDDHTLVTYFFSNNPYVRQYEKDLLQGMKKGNRALFQLGVSEQRLAGNQLDAQISLSLDGESRINEDFLPLCSILPGQLTGFFKSLQLGLMPDAPSTSGAISRVVEGVNIYPAGT